MFLYHVESGSFNVLKAIQNVKGKKNRLYQKVDTQGPKENTYLNESKFWGGWVLIEKKQNKQKSRTF